MTHYPQTFPKRSASTPSGATATVRQKLARDILWNQPVFKAPVLANPRIALDPLPFTANRPNRPKHRA
jgi:hypothetical protein